MNTLFAVTTVAMAAMPVVLLPGNAESQEWPTREFQVISAEALPGATGPQLVPAFNAISEQLDAWLAAWGMDPTGARIYVPDAQTRSEIEGYLTEAASLLDRWGFPPPELPIRSGKYQVVLAVETPAALRGEEAAGTYHPPICGTIGGYVFLSAAAILGDVEDGGGRRLTPRGMGTLAHELFHAVQANTRFFGAGCPPTVGNWITEGTADAIGIDVLRTLRGETVGNWIEAWGARSYSRRLPVPFIHSLLPRDWSDEELEAYYTSSFWRYLAEYQALGEFPGPELNPVDYSYLAAMLARGGAVRDCDASDAECDSELRWLDLGTQQAFGLTLSELYPRFIDALALYGEHRMPADSDDQRVSNQDRWQEEVFNLPRRDASTGCEHVYLTPGQTVERGVISRFDAVAAECWSILTEGFDGDVPVRIEVKAPPGATALSDLSAVIAGRPIWVNTADLRVDSETNQPTATWVQTFPLGQSRLFILTNVARDPGATTRMLNLPITFTALGEYVAMDVSGSESRGGSDDGPTLDDIARPFDFDVAEGDLTVFYVTPDDFDELELDHPVCTVWIKLRSQQDDALWVMGNIASPIRAGVYEIVSAPGGRPDLLGSRLWTSRTAGRGRQQTFGKSGTLEIEAVDHLMIEGNVRTHVHKGLEGGDVNLLVEAEFGLQPGSMVSGILGPKAADHPCFVEGDAPILAGGTGGGDPNRGRDPSGGRSADGGNTGEDEQSSDEDDGFGDADESGSGRLAATGQADNEKAPGDPDGQPSPGGGDVVPTDDSKDGEPGVAATALQLEFLDREGASIQSRPQEVRGEHSPERVHVSASSFGLQLALHQDLIWHCAEGGNSDLAGIYALTGLGMDGATAIDWDRWYRIDVRDAEVELNVDAGGVRLELDFEHCREDTGRCQSGIVVVRADPEDVHLTSAGAGSTRVDVSGAALEAELNRQKGTCEGLVDYSATLRAAP